MAKKDKDVETKVVQMEFDNGKFNKDVDTTTKKVGKLDESVRMKGADKDVNKVTSSFKALANEIKRGFLIRTGQKLFDNIARSVKVTMTSLLGINNIRRGWEAYEESLTTVGGMINNIERYYDNVTEASEAATEAMATLQWYSDETSFSFDTMSKGIQQFTTAGIELERATNAAMGVTAVAASSKVFDQNKVQSAMNAISKAMAQGYMDLEKWNTLSQTSGIVNQEFSETLLEMAAAEGKLVKSQAGQYRTLKGKGVNAFNIANSFDGRNSWLTSDILSKTLEKYSSAATKVKEIQEAIDNGTADASIRAYMMENELDSIDMTTNEVLKMYKSLGRLETEFDAVSLKALKSAQETSSYSQAVGYIMDSVKTSWQNMFSAMFGSARYVENELGDQVSEAVALWSDVSDSLGSMFAEPFAEMAEIFEEWHDMSVGGFTDFREAVSGGFHVLDRLLGTVKDAFKEVFVDIDADLLQSITIWLKDTINSLKNNDSFYENLKEVLKSIFNILKLLGTVIGKLLKMIGQITVVLEPVITWILEALNKLFDLIGNGFSKAKELVTGFGKSFNDAGEEIKNSKFGEIVEWIKNLFSSIADFVDKHYVSQGLKGFAKALAEVIGIILAVKGLKFLYKVGMGWFDIKESIVDFFDSMRIYFKAKTVKDLTAVVVGLSAAIIGMIAAAYYFKDIDWAQLLRILGLVIGFVATFTAMLVVVYTTSANATKNMSWGAIMKFNSYIAISVGVMIMMITAIGAFLAMKYLNFSVADLTKGLITMTIMVGLYIAAMKILDRGIKVSGEWTKEVKKFDFEGNIGASFGNIIKYLILLGGSILALYGAMKLFTEFEDMSIVQKIFISVVLGTISVIMLLALFIGRGNKFVGGNFGNVAANINLFGLNVFGVAASLVVLAVAVIYLYKNMEILTDQKDQFDWKPFATIGIILGSVLIGLLMISMFSKLFMKGITKNVTKNLLRMAFTISLIVTTVSVLVFAITKLLNVSAVVLIPLFVTMAFVILAIGAAMALSILPMAILTASMKGAVKAGKPLKVQIRGLLGGLLGIAILFALVVGIMWYCNTQIDEATLAGNTITEHLWTLVKTLWPLWLVLGAVSVALFFVGKGMKGVTNSVWGLVALFISVIATILIFSNILENSWWKIIISAAMIGGILYGLIELLSLYMKKLQNVKEPTKAQFKKTKTLLNFFAIMFTLVAGTIVGFTFIDQGKLWSSVAAVSVIIALVFGITQGIALVMREMKKTGAPSPEVFRRYCGLFWQFNSLVLILSGIVVGLSFIPVSKLWNAYGATAAIVALAIGVTQIVSLILKEMKKIGAPSPEVFRRYCGLFWQVNSLIVILSAIVVVMTHVPAGKLWNAYGATAAIVALAFGVTQIISLTLKEMKKIGTDIGGFAKYIILLASVTVVISALTALVIALSLTPSDKIWAGVLQVTALVALATAMTVLLTLVAWLAKRVPISAIGKSVAIMATGLVGLAGLVFLVAKLAIIPEDRIWELYGYMWALTGLVTGMITILALLGALATWSGIGLVGIAVGLGAFWLFAEGLKDVVDSMSLLNLFDMDTFIDKCGSLLKSMALIQAAFGGAIGTSAKMIVYSFALDTITFSLMRFGSMLNAFNFNAANSLYEFIAKIGSIDYGFFDWLGDLAQASRLSDFVKGLNKGLKEFDTERANVFIDFANALARMVQQTINGLDFSIQIRLIPVWDTSSSFAAAQSAFGSFNSATYPIQNYQIPEYPGSQGQNGGNIVINQNVYGLDGTPYELAKESISRAESAARLHTGKYNAIQ